MRIVVVMPARDEAALIESSIQAVPDIVDWIIVVDDGSTDATASIAAGLLGTRGELIQTGGEGVGGAIAAGSQQALTRYGEDCIVVVMAGDGQMDGTDLPTLIRPILDGRADHVKGNRWLHADGPKGMPLIRRLGTWWLSHLTSLASGLRIKDTQCGYTATSGKMLNAWDWSKTWAGYGYPNWWLMEAGRLGFRIEEAPVRSVYGLERSGIRLIQFFTSVSWMLWKGVWRRGWDWYIRGRGTSPHLRVIAATLWFGGWCSLFLIDWSPIGILLCPLAFGLLMGLDRKESKRRRATVTA
jgi:glycosyltransferase involved in cell wall biosynthesis